ncbi:hypothetical protein AYI70_g11235 [Smittium culicis]|uniref:Uncharacterized protein n=1 Tax=Smittium culicis TaxID=133412 RepID=A0A1R1X2Q9_9FUNG|nr:hypothetical protein AYI70_g11235 [Smittium culicis]
MLNCHSHVMLKTFGSVYRPKLVPAMNTNIIRSISSHMLGNTKSGVKVALLPQLAVHMRSTSQRFCHNSGAHSARSAAGIPVLTRQVGAGGARSELEFECGCEERGQDQAADELLEVLQGWAETGL